MNRPAGSHPHASLDAATTPDSALPHAAHRTSIHPHASHHRASFRVACPAREGHPIPHGTRCPGHPPLNLDA